MSGVARAIQPARNLPKLVPQGVTFMVGLAIDMRDSAGKWVRLGLLWGDRCGAFTSWGNLSQIVNGSLRVMVRKRCTNLGLAGERCPRLAEGCMGTLRAERPWSVSRRRGTDPGGPSPSAAKMAPRRRVPLRHRRSGCRRDRRQDDRPNRQQVSAKSSN
jgi:hypothetical protein